MMKILFICLFMFIMMIYNNKIMFYYNLCFLVSFIYMFEYMFKDLIWIKISLFFGFDYYSYFLVMLSFWLVGLMLMVIQGMENKEGSLKLVMFLMMMLVLIMYFFSMNLLMFYLMFELSLIPTFIMVIYWGMNLERLSASFYLLMYTMLISMPLLIYIMSIFKVNYSYDMNLLKLNYMNLNILDYLMLFMAFYIKMPMYLFHIWLPKAHVEAPVYGSMILAAVLLKLGSYGLLRFIELFYNNNMNYNYIIISIAMMGSVFSSLICMIQIDMKSLVAYSSVVHMNVMLTVMVSMFKLGLISAYILMISHGLCSSGLFFLVNLYYERSCSRLMFFNKGMLNIYPILGLWWFLFCVINFSFPFSLNFVSEIFMISVILAWDFMLMIYLMLICFFSSAYSLYLYIYIQHGSMVYVENNFYIVYLKDYLILILHFIPLLLLLLNLTMLM